MTAAQRVKLYPRPRPAMIYVGSEQGEPIYVPLMKVARKEPVNFARFVAAGTAKKGDGENDHPMVKVTLPPPPPEAPSLNQGSHAPPAGEDPGERERRWQRCVDEARGHVATLHAARARIVELAREACDIRWGGGAHWSGHEGVYTARRFAQETGVEYKTLMNWLRVWREVTDHLGPGEWKDSDFKYAQRAVKKCGANATPDERVRTFRKLRDGQRESYHLSSVVNWARSHLRFLQRSPDLDDREALLALRALCVQTIEEIDARTRQ